MKFHTQYERPERKPEPHSNEKITEQAGYIPPKIQIENMIDAGIRLDQARLDAFDFKPDEEVPDDFTVPVRDQGFDLADAHALQQEVEYNLKQQALEAEQKEKSGKKKDSGSIPESEPEENIDPE